MMQRRPMVVAEDQGIKCRQGKRITRLGKADPTAAPVIRHSTQPQAERKPHPATPRGFRSLYVLDDCPALPDDPLTNRDNRHVRRGGALDGVFVVNFNIAMMIPLLPFIERSMALSPAQAGTILAAFPIAALVGNLALGPLIDRLGRKRFIVTGAAACTVIFLATAAARSPLPIACGRAATGLFMPMIGASVYAAIADYVPPERRARMAGYVTSAAPVAFMASMSMGMLLGGLVAWQVPLLLLALVTLALTIGAAALPPTPADALAHTPLSVRSYRDRFASLSLDQATRLLLVAYFCWSAAVFVFLGLYPSWVVQHGLAAYGAGAIGAMLFLGEIGGLFGALLSGRLAREFSHPLGLCAVTALASAVIVLVVPVGTGFPTFQGVAYWGFAFGRDLMLALMLGGAMLLVPAAQRGSLNAMMNAIYQTGATIGGMASAWLYSLRPDFAGNAVVACGLLGVAGLMLRRITRIEARAAL
jgi:predicted MFS family arabinose efflux permease